MITPLSTEASCQARGLLSSLSTVKRTKFLTCERGQVKFLKKSMVSSVIFRRLLFLIVLGTLVVGGCAPAKTPQVQPANDPSLVTKYVSFAVLEDYEKGDELDEVALDFALMNELEIDTMRTSFGWDNFEPSRQHSILGYMRT